MSAVISPATRVGSLRSANCMNGPLLLPRVSSCDLLGCFGRSAAFGMSSIEGGAALSRGSRSCGVPFQRYQPTMPPKRSVMDAAAISPAGRVKARREGEVEAGEERVRSLVVTRGW